MTKVQDIMTRGARSMAPSDSVVQAAQIMDELIRVTSKSIDELQATMSHVRGQRFQLPLQFTNQRS